jgi:hypothetical protein
VHCGSRRAGGRLDARAIRLVVELGGSVRLHHPVRWRTAVAPLGPSCAGVSGHGLDSSPTGSSVAAQLSDCDQAFGRDFRWMARPRFRRVTRCPGGLSLGGPRRQRARCPPRRRDWVNRVNLPTEDILDLLVAHGFRAGVQLTIRRTRPERPIPYPAGLPGSKRGGRLQSDPVRSCRAPTSATWRLDPRLRTGRGQQRRCWMGCSKLRREG